MTNSLNKMAGKNNIERSGSVGSASKPRGKQRAKSSPTTVMSSSPPRFNQPMQQRQSPLNTGRGSPRSPGLSYFAGAKWTDPPSPTALPLPPIHWTQQTKHCTTLNFCNKEEASANIGGQLKMLLHTQAWPVKTTFINIDNRSQCQCPDLIVNDRWTFFKLNLYTNFYKKWTIHEAPKEGTVYYFQCLE